MRRSLMTGLDGANFQLKLMDADANAYMEKQKINNKAGELLSEIWIRRGILNVYINFPRLLRDDNIWPLSLPDYPKFKEAESSLVQVVQNILEEQWIFCDVRKSSLRKVEVGTTQSVEKGSSPNAVNRLINYSFYEYTNTVYTTAKETYRYCKREDSVTCPFIVDKIEYIIKSYDKSREQHNAGNILTESGLLRIEIVFLRAAIKKLFGRNVLLEDIFCKENLIKLLNEYKRLFVDVVVGKYINTCLEDTQERILQELKRTGSPVETIGKCKEFIFCEDVMRKSLRQWYEYKGCIGKTIGNNTNKMMHDFKKYELPKGVCKTIRQFEEACR